ncbi:MAG TPA: VWA domain-containing protein, partial [Candidatus Angelobacter sp.]|nr:VWA domain-containing protein [Candidatus Angelobacter sp.]
MESNSRRKLSWVPLLTMVFACAMPVGARAQGQPAPPAPATPSAEQVTGPVIRKETRLVLVDAVVMDKKGNYVHDLTQSDFKVYEDNKEQAVSAFSSGAEAVTQPNGQRHYLILFFDNSTMAAPDQIQARGAAKKFIEANAGPDRLMAVMDFGGSLRIVQNFTANANLLSAAVSGVKNSNVDPNASDPSAGIAVASTNPASIPMGMSSLSNAEADFGARTMLLALRSLAKNLRTVPGRKMVVLFSGGFPLTTENQSELTATIDACNKANVAIYALDARGLFAPVPGGSAMNRTSPGSVSGRVHSVSAHSQYPSNSARSQHPRKQQAGIHPWKLQGGKLLLAAYPAMAMPSPQRPGGGGGGGTGGGGGAGGGGGRGGGGTGGGTGGGPGGGGKGGG